MALLIDSSAPAGGDSPTLGDDQIRAFKLAVRDIFTIPNNTTIATALGSVSASGLQYWAFNDEAANAAAAGRLQRNAANLTWHDGTAARNTIFDTATQTLTNKTLTTPTIGSFANATHNHLNAAGGGTLGFKITTITRDTTVASGDVAYTGIGFQPRFVRLSSATASDTSQHTAGISDGTNHYCWYGVRSSGTGFYSVDATKCFRLQDLAGNTLTAIVKTLDADGFTLTWTRTGAISDGTATVIVECF